MTRQLKGKVKTVIFSHYRVSGNKDKWTKEQKYSSSNYKYLYDKNGMLVETHIYNNNIFLGKELHTYDDTNHLLESKGFDGRGTFLAQKTGSFDKEKKLHIIKQYNPENNLVYTKEMYEDERGSIIKEIKKTPQAITHITQSEYDKQNRCVKQISQSNNKKLYVNHSSVYKNYDEHGNFTLIDFHNQENNKKSLRTFQYKYDSQGNWIHMIEFMDNKAHHLTEREIAYY